MWTEFLVGGDARNPAAVRLLHAFGLSTKDRAPFSAPVAVSLRRLLPPSEVWEGTELSLHDAIRVVERHHDYARGVVEFIDVALDEAEATEPDNECIRALHRCFDALASELIVHFEKEEQVVFPALLDGRGPMIGRSIQHVSREHDIIRDLLERIRGAAEKGCGSRPLRVLQAALEVLGFEIEAAVTIEQEQILRRVMVS